MNKKLNKLVTNYPVELNEEEIENLSATLAPVIAACGGGGGTGGKIYTGTGFVNVNNTTNQIGLTEDANDKLNKEYVEYNEYSTAIANRYTKTQTNDLLDEKQNTLEFEYDENNKVSAINGSALAGQGGTTYTPGQYINIDSNNEISVTGLVAIDEYATYSGDWNDVSNSYKTNSGSFLTSEDLTPYSTIEHANDASANAFNQASALIPDVSNFITKDVNDLTNYYSKTQTSSDSELSTEFTKYATTTYVDSKDPVLIGDNNITATSSKIGNHTQWNLAVNVTPVVTDTKLVGDNCVTAHTTEVSGEWAVGLVQSAYEAIDSIGGIATDVATLKNASANWNKVSDKLDTTAAEQTYLEKATYASDSATFLTQDDLSDYYKKTDTSSKTELSTEFAKYQPKGNYLVANDITGKLDKSIYANASGKWENASNVVATNSANWNEKVDQGDLDDYLTKAQYGTDSATFALKTQLDDYYKKTDTSSKTELSTEFAKYVTTSTLDTVSSTLDGDIEYVSGQVDNKVDKPTSLSNKYLVLRTDSNGDVSGWCDLQDQSYSKSDSQGTFVHHGMLDNGTGGTLTGTGLTGGTVLGVNTDVIQTKLTDEQISAIGEVSSKLDRADLDDYVPYSATKLAIGSNNDISESNSNNSFAQGTNNKVSTSPNSFVQGEANSAVNYYSLAQGYGNYAQDHSLAQGTTNNAITVSLAQGQNNTAKSFSIAQGTQNSADTTAFAQGSANKAKYDSFAQGNRNSAYSYSFAQGSMNYADNNALAQGGNNTAKYFSQALGFGLSIQGSRGVTDGTDYISGGLAIGTYNQTSAGVAFVVGNGHSNGANVEPTRSDAFVIYPDGRVSAAGNITANGVELGAGGGTSFTAGSGVEIVSNGINALLGTDLAFNATTSAIQINTNGTAYGVHAFVEGTNTTASGGGAHAEGVDAGAIGQGAHAGGYGTHTTGVGNFIHGTFLNFASPDGTTNSNTPVFVGGTLNATTAQNYNDHGGYLQIMGNGVYRSAGQGDNSDAYILYRDGTVSAKQFQNADGTETINGTTYNFTGVDNIEILPNAATANTANFPNDNVLRFILES